MRSMVYNSYATSDLVIIIIIIIIIPSPNAARICYADLFTTQYNLT